MDIYALLKKDHRKVSELFAKLEAARSDSTRLNLLETIEYELLLHAKTEEATFYAALEGIPETHLNALMPEVESDHDEVRLFFEKLRAAKVGSSKWLMLVGGLKHAVEHHVQEEEGMIFTYARKVLSDIRAAELGRQMLALKKSEPSDEVRIHEAPVKAA